MTDTRATANMVTATAYATLEVEPKRLKTELEQLKRKRPPRAKQQKQNPKNKQLLEMGNRMRQRLNPLLNSSTAMQMVIKKKRPHFVRMQAIGWR
jgi:hypothetical protein